MKTQQHIQTIQQMYADFGQGNIPGILTAVADNFSWDHAGNPTDTPFAGQYEGKDGFLQFFQAMNKAGEVVKWKVNSVEGIGNKVYALGEFGIKSRTTGKTGEDDWAMVFTFEGDKPVAGRAFVDTKAMADTFA
jgi:ketosteroid isomerase-like protein